MVNFWSLNIKPNQPYNLSTIKHFSTFHLTTITLSLNSKKKATLYAIIKNEKFLLASVSEVDRSRLLDLYFICSQNCQFVAEGAEIIISGYYKLKKKEKSIIDDDEFKAIAFKAGKLEKELEDLHDGKHKNKKRK